MTNTGKASSNKVSKAAKAVSNNSGLLYVVATPIGNLEDITRRSVRVLSEADLIAAEDTRHSKKLLQHLGISVKTIAFHEHNERTRTPELLGLLRDGQCIALISDAGTPLVSDPGFRLVRAAHAAGIRVVPVPGPCAAVAALSVAGLPTDRFVFEGFPPARTAARDAFFERLKHEPRTLIFYETPHRLRASLNAMTAAFGPGREAVVARELTKKFETILTGTLGELGAVFVGQRDARPRGEFVILVHGAAPSAARTPSSEAERILRALLRELSVKQSAALASEITGVNRRKLYQLALSLQRR